MKEDIFLKVGYSTYLQKDKKKNWTSKMIGKIKENKLITTILVVIIMSVIMNFWLIYKFMSILETSNIL